MTKRLEIILKCPQDHKDCEGEKECKKDKSKGCAIETLRVWQIEQEDRWSIL